MVEPVGAVASADKHRKDRPALRRCVSAVGHGAAPRLGCPDKRSMLPPTAPVGAAAVAWQWQARRRPGKHRSARRRLHSDRTVRAHDLVEALGAEHGAQQVGAGLDGQLAPDLALRGDLADRLEPRPGMALLQPGDIIAHAGPALLDPAMAAVSIGGDGERRGGIVEEGAHVAMQRALVALERQDPRGRPEGRLRRRPVR